VLGLGEAGADPGFGESGRHLPGAEETDTQGVILGHGIGYSEVRQ
jgi:hypothetical protein